MMPGGTISSVRDDAVTDSAIAVPALAPDATPTDWTFRIFMAVVSVVSGLGVLAFIAKGGKISNLNDFYAEAWPAYRAASHGHLLHAFQLSPAYVGSLVLRAPFALVPTIWGGGPRAVFFAAGLPCMLAVAGFCVWVAEQLRRHGRSVVVAALAPVLLCIFSPVIIIALGDGHPEELLGAVLCVAAVVCAARGNVKLAGVLIVLAVINKSWALAAVPVVLAVMPTIPRRAIALLAAGAGIVAVIVAVSASQGVHAFSLTGTIGDIFNPPQLLWWFGRQSWIVQKSRALILLIAIALSVVWRLGRKRDLTGSQAVPEALLLLALVLFARAAFDPWDNLYYHVPFLFALIAYETTSGRLPRLTLIYSILLFMAVPLKSFPPMSFHTRAVAYACVAVPTFLWMGVRVYGGAGAWKRLLGRPWSSSPVTPTS
jgi:hypothetical protein